MPESTFNTAQKSSGITRISVTGFKSLANKTDVEIRPLTVLAGANSSGKSSLMQPLLLMKQTLESAFEAAGPFLLSGPYVQYTETKQFLSRVGASPQPFTLEFSLDEGLIAGVTYSTDRWGTLYLAPDRLQRSIRGVTYSTDSWAALSVAENWGSNATKRSKWKLTKMSTQEELREMLLSLGLIPLQVEDADLRALSTVQCGFYLCVLLPKGSRQTGMGMHGAEPYYMQENLALSSHVGRLVYVPGIRGSQSRKSLLAEVTGHGFFPGSFESYAPSVVFSWILPGNRHKMQQLVNALSLLNLASGISPVRLNESELEIRIPRARDSAEDDFINIADVGLAVPTVLPVLVALIQADPGQLVYIEQPELHLHPRAQWRLAQLLAQAANRGVRLVIETHSSLLLRGILTQIAENKIANDKVILHWFERNNETGISSVHTKEPDSAGRVGDWPEDFSDVELKSDNEYLDAVDKKLYAEAK